MQGRRLALQEEGKLGVDGRIADRVIVVQEQHPGRCCLGKPVYEHGEYVLKGRCRRGVQERQDIVKAAGSALIQRAEHRGPEAHGIIVSLIQGDPGHPRLVLRQRAYPGRDQRGFAKARRSGDQDELLLATLVEQSRQARTGDKRVQRGRDEKLGRYQGLLPRRPALVTLHCGGQVLRRQ